MPRIQIQLEQEVFDTFEEISENLNKGDESITRTAKRTATLRYLVEAVGKAHEVVIAHKKEIESLNLKLAQLESTYESQISKMAQGLEKKQLKVERISAELMTQQEISECFKSAIHYLTEPSDG